MIVADANLLVYQAIETQFSPWAHKWSVADPVWFAPAVWRFEFVNAIVTHARSGKISSDESSLVISESIQRYSANERVIDQASVFRTAMRYRISAYDANYIVLAEMLNTYCVTGDRQMLERVPRWTRALSNLP